MSTTLFTWGYFGWGNATPRLVEIADAVERDRGFAPPMFVDIRIRRTVRAKGLQGAAFGHLLGPGRHVWMQGLGNEAIRTGEGGIRISDPAQANDLLDLALADTSRRVIFFCSCQWPMLDGQVACHRRTVADLLLDAARRRGEEIEVVEWSGGEPTRLEVEVTPAVLAALARGRSSVPLGDDLPPAALGGLPWGSIVATRSGGREARLVAGPARHHAGEWQLPVFEAFANPETADAEVEARARALRRGFGLEGRLSLA